MKLFYILVEKYRCVFLFLYFNIVQIKVFDEVYDQFEYGYRKSKGYCYVSLILFLINKNF